MQIMIRNGIFNVGAINAAKPLFGKHVLQPHLRPKKRPLEYLSTCEPNRETPAPLPSALVVPANLNFVAFGADGAVDKQASGQAFRAFMAHAGYSSATEEDARNADSHLQARLGALTCTVPVQEIRAHRAMTGKKAWATVDYADFTIAPPNAVSFGFLSVPRRVVFHVAFEGIVCFPDALKASGASDYLKYERAILPSKGRARDLLVAWHKMIARDRATDIMKLRDEARKDWHEMEKLKKLDFPD